MRIGKEMHMKKLTALLLVILLLGVISTASAATVIDAESDRGIIPKGDPTQNNPRIPGESMTTGLPFEGEYIPILVNIDNVHGAWPQWGIGDADIIYEMPIAGWELTRLVALFADKHPQNAGPVRSGRVLHAELREEWDAGWTFAGIQNKAGTNVNEALRKFGARKKTHDLIYDLNGNKFSKYYHNVKDHKPPHHHSVHVQELVEHARGYEFPERPFLFTDALPTVGDTATSISLVYNCNKACYTNSAFTYDATTNLYTRTRRGKPYVDQNNPDQALTFSNVIVQWTDLSFNGAANAPVLREVGTGNADIFMGGRYIAGLWKRSDMTSRTVFYDENGEEIRLQRGKTWITVTARPSPEQRSKGAKGTEVTYE
ncbi:MAG: DUF3048 domain-containing protein [Christensenellales bacterium]